MSLFETRAAAFSPCRRYRYRLVIRWSEGDLLTVIGLNPSTADEVQDDPTLRRVKGFARDMGLAGVQMLNAYAWRSTDPSVLRTIADPVGPENTLENLKSWIRECSPCAVAAWGTKIILERERELLTLPHLHCFRRTKAGKPEHPLYLPAELRPVPLHSAGTTQKREDLR